MRGREGGREGGVGRRLRWREVELQSVVNTITSSTRACLQPTATPAPVPGENVCNQYLPWHLFQVTKLILHSTLFKSTVVYSNHP